ncbi:MAG: 50S ribosomal protein L11 methyltransferase [Desulfobacterales bacterium]|nr:50S ribosomal protein L11 methyltransferase [Desulfobacterales bacterium]
MESYIEIEKYILDAIDKEIFRITSNDMEKQASSFLGVDRKQVKLCIKKLIEKEEVVFNFEHGHTFLERSFNKPVQLSNYVVIKPSNISYQKKNKEIVVNIEKGISFGDGRHPSTRLAIKGIEYCLVDLGMLKDKNDTSVLDIGTGSGILAIVSLLFGIKKAYGLDIDLNAIQEAKLNASNNCLYDDRIQISNVLLESLNLRFDLILANLRYPTLYKIADKINSICLEEGFVVLSGIRDDEANIIKDIYSRSFSIIWSEGEKGWESIVFRKVKNQE